MNLSKLSCERDVRSIIEKAGVTFDKLVTLPFHMKISLAYLFLPYKLFGCSNIVGFFSLEKQIQKQF
jgi:hypothetical protein